MPVRPLAEAQDVIGPYTDALVAIIEGAHSEFLEACRPILHKMNDRSKASTVRDLIVDRLRIWLRQFLVCISIKKASFAGFAFKITGSPA